MPTSINMNGAASGSGLDVDSIVSQMIEVERAPERIWQSQKNLLQMQAAVLNDLQAKLGSLETNVTMLKDALGVFSETIATSSNESLLRTTAGTGATAGWHAIQIESLASNASYYSNALPTDKTEISAGSFTIKVGNADPVKISVNQNNNTLDTLAAHINSLGLGVNATVVTDVNGARLAITGQKTGTTNDVTISNVSGFTFTASSTARNAKLTVDGIPIESASNEIAGVIAGVTLKLNNAAPGETVTVNVAPEHGKVTQAIQNFVSSFNSIVKAIGAQFAFDPATNSAGVLSGDSTLRSLQQELLGSISYAASGNTGLASLGTLGITMRDDGTLNVDSSKLQPLVQSDFKGVKQFFQGKDSNGFANSIGTILDRLTDSISGPLVVNLKGNSESQKSLTDQIDDFEVRVEVRRQQLLMQYSQLDAILRQFPITQNQVTAQLASLSGLKK